VSALLVTTAATLRRLLRPGAFALALLAGVLTGLAVLSLPSTSLARDVFAGLLRVLAAVVVLPLAAGVPTADRSGGYERLQALRPQSSLAWATGRMLGSVIGAAALVLVLSATSRWIAGERPMPAEVEGLRMDQRASMPTWRFPLPAGARGPFDLGVPLLLVPPGGGTMEVEVTRGDGAQTLPPVTVMRHRALIVVPDLWPERGDLFVTLRPSAELTLAATAPRLTVGERPLGRAGLPLPRDAARALLVALLAALAAACAFHFETACLAGLLALSVELPAGAWPLAAAAVLLLGFASLGTALLRRQALP